MRKYRKNQILLVDWIDTMQDPEWKSEEAASKRPACDCQTVGFYLKHDKEFVYLSQTVMSLSRDITTIPLGCIKGVRKLQ